MAARSTQPPRAWLAPASFYRGALAHPWYGQLLNIYSSIALHAVSFWADRGLNMPPAPVTTGSVSSPMAVGSDSKPVSVCLGGADVYLADSMQFVLEYCCRFSKAGAFYLMPSFRGEPSDETHLAEFLHFEAELVTTLDSLLTLVDEFIASLCHCIMDRHMDEIRNEGGETNHIAKLASGKTVERMTFEEAAKCLSPSDLAKRSVNGRTVRSLTRAGEARLCEHVGGPVWVTHWDHLAVPFYQAFADSGMQCAANADLILGGREVVGAGQRHATGDDLQTALALHDVDPGAYEWYIDMKAEQPLLTAGFGIGIERFLMWVLSQDDIRDVAFIPRISGARVCP